MGEIIDISCYLQLGKHGEKHSCGPKCAQNSQPVGLLTRSGQIYILMAEEHDPLRDGGVVEGAEATVGGNRAIFVQGLTK